MRTTGETAPIVAFLAAVLAAPLTLGSPPAVSASQTPPPPEARKETVKLPQTPEEHLAMSEEYLKKAASYREEAAFHRKMLADYRRSVPTTPRQPFENPYVKKMRLHCEAYIKGAEALAIDAEKLADFHRFRAAELQGK